MKKEGKAKANGHAIAADLRELPPGWLWVRLEDLASPEPRSITDGPFGSNLKSEHYTDTGPRVVRLENIGHGQFIDKPVHISEKHYRRLERHAVAAGDLVIAILGSPLPRACIVPASLGAAIVKADCIRFRPDIALVDNRFACWWINSKEPQKAAEDAIHGVGRPRLGMQNVKDLMVPLAPRPEQDRIVAKLDELFSDIEAGEKALERAALLVKRYRQSVLKDAVTGELTKDWRVKNLARLKRERRTGADLLAEILLKRRAFWEAAELARMMAKGKPPKDDKWKKKYVEPTAPKTDELPELPEGWVWGTLDCALAGFGNGLSKAPSNEPPGTPILRISAVRAMSVQNKDIRYYQAELCNELDGYWVQKGDLLFTRYNGSASLVGVCGLYRSDAEVLHPDKLIKARLLPEVGLDPRFFEIVLNAGASKAFIESRVKTSAGQHGIAGGDVRIAPVPFGPLEEQAKIVQQVEEELSRADVMSVWLSQAGKQASSLRQAVLRSAFAGELVRQDQYDEPASALIERIRAERNAPKSSTPKAQAKAKKPRTRRGRSKKATESRNAQGKVL